MRSSTSETPRGHGRDRGDSVNVDVNANAAGWPLVQNRKVAAMEVEAGVASQGRENSRSVDILAQEVEDLIERQPQFAFLKPCRQLEKHYTTKRNAMTAAADSSSFRHSHAAKSDGKKGSDGKNGEQLIQSNSSSSGKVLEDAQSKPGSVRGGTIRELLSYDGIELNGFTVDGHSGAQGASSTGRVVTKECHHAAPAARRHGSSRGHFHRLSGERIWRISSTRCSIHEKEAHIDLVNPAAAQFLVEMSPGKNSVSPPPVAVPFKWEDVPGRAKAHSAATAHPALQLPPRLAAVPRSDTALPGQIQVSVISHPLAGFFPCIGANSPSPSRPALQEQQQRHTQQQQDHITWMHYRASKSYGGVHRNARKQSKSFSQPLVSTDQSSSMGVKPRRRLFSSELASASCAEASTSTSSILHGSRQSSSSQTYLSCELGASTPRTVGSKSSSSVSYDSIGEDFDHDEGSATSPHSFAGGAPRAQSRRPRRADSKGLLKLCKRQGNCLRKSKSRRRIRSPEVWAPTLATYFQRMDVNEEPLLEKQAAAPTSSAYLNSRGEPQPLHSAQVATPTSSGYLNSTGESIPLYSAQAPTSSGFLNSKGEPQPLRNAHGASPTSSGHPNSKMNTTPLRSVQGAAAGSRGCVTSKGESVSLHCAGAGAGGSSSSPEVSPQRPTRLPYKMPSVAEQERGRCRSSSRSSSRSTDLQCPSPVYASALDLLSPAAVTLMASRRQQRHGTPRAVASPKPHRRVQFILSMCKTLKRVLFRQPPRRSVIGARLMYHDERAPTTFQFSKPN